MWGHLLSALSRLGRAPSDVVGVMLTHAHFDHVGLAARIGRTWGVPVWVHHADETLAHLPYTYQRERSRVLFPLRHPRSLPILGSMVLAGALGVRGVTDVVPVGVDAAIPGSPA
ncbi:MBL fold metallo-hydrolase [Rhodococcus kroppenstedtii]|uniref:MBL fold metallo-hydrolase n=1 Tax=Rhodococcoides kroppenstedtii TaxID=293050 RepID=UPI0029557521|nr:MBL fold metallo-hydrolase [Rhodococcus kroppenstedtii]MDV7196539.1 MBL fold metallo-hydrolase [Rhodococcus kroppenstedtii]